MNVQDIVDHLAITPGRFLISPREPFRPAGREADGVVQLRHVFNLAAQELLRRTNETRQNYHEVLPADWWIPTESFERIRNAIEQTQAETAFTSARMEADNIEPRVRALREGQRVRITGPTDTLYDVNADDLADQIEQGEVLRGDIIERSNDPEIRDGWVVRIDDWGSWHIPAINLEVII